MTANSAAFLKLIYPETDFLINKRQVESSFFHHDIDNKGTPLSLPLEHAKKFHTLTNAHLVQTIPYKSTTILLFDFNSYLHSLFQLEEYTVGKLGLVFNLNAGLPDSQLLYDSFLEKYLVDNEIDPTLVAMKTTGNAQIISENAYAIKIIPGCLRFTLQLEGLLGIRFISKERMQYFLDLEKLFCKMLEYLMDLKDGVYGSSSEQNYLTNISQSNPDGGKNYV